MVITQVGQYSITVIILPFALCGPKLRHRKHMLLPQQAHRRTRDAHLLHGCNSGFTNIIIILYYYIIYFTVLFWIRIGRQSCSTHYTDQRRCYTHYQMQMTQENAMQRCTELGGYFPKMERSEDNRIAAAIWAFQTSAMIGINDFSGSWRNADGTARESGDANLFSLSTWPTATTKQVVVLTGSILSHTWNTAAEGKNFFCEFREGIAIYIVCF